MNLEDKKWSVREYVSSKSYSFSFPMSWAIYTVNDQTGEFTIQSDWGDYTYRWNIECIGDATLHEFLADADPGYVVDKLAQNKHPSFRRQFDPEGTLESLQSAICEMRRTTEITKDQARDAWNYLEEGRDEFLGISCSLQAETILSYNDPLVGFLDYSEHYLYKPSDGYNFCKDTSLPFFKKFLEDKRESEVEQEKKRSQIREIDEIDHLWNVGFKAASEAYAPLTAEELKASDPIVIYAAAAMIRENYLVESKKLMKEDEEIKKYNDSRERRLAFAVQVARLLPTARISLVYEDNRSHHALRVNGVVFDTDIQDPKDVVA